MLGSGFGGGGVEVVAASAGAGEATPLGFESDVAGVPLVVGAVGALCLTA